MARGSLTRREGQRGCYWRLQARDATGRVRETRLPWKTKDGRTITTKAQAEARLAEFLRELQEGPSPAFVGQDRRRVRFGEVAHEWWTVQTASARTREDYQTLLNSQILPVLGDLPIGDISKTRVQQFVQQCQAAPATVKKALFITKSVLEHAVDARLIPHNPARGVKSPRLDRKPLNVWTPGQVATFLESFPQDELKWKVFSELLLLAGLRFGEAAALTPAQITADTVIVDRSCDERGHRIKPTKSGRARSVDLHLRLKSDLLAYLERTGMARDALLFPGARRGGCLSNSWFAKKVWLAAIKRAGVPVIRPHDARHTFVAHLLEAGENPVYVKEQAGHHSAAFTLDYYGHLIPSRGRAYNLPTRAYNLPIKTLESGDPA